MGSRDSRRPLHKSRLSSPVLIIICFAHFALAQAQTSTKEPPIGQPLVSDQGDAIGIEELRKSLRQLTREVERLARRVSDFEKERLFDITRTLLVGEELRAEALQSRLRENSERTTAYHLRLDQVDNQLRPENIERLFIGVGLVRPEEARDTVRRRLFVERQSLVNSLEHLRQERNRFQSALATSDVALQRLRLRLSMIGRP